MRADDSEDGLGALSVPVGGCKASIRNNRQFATATLPAMNRTGLKFVWGQNMRERSRVFRCPEWCFYLRQANPELGPSCFAAMLRGSLGVPPRHREDTGSIAARMRFPIAPRNRYCFCVPSANAEKCHRRLRNKMSPANPEGQRVGLGETGALARRRGGDRAAHEPGPLQEPAPNEQWQPVDTVPAATIAHEAIGRTAGVETGV
jgi:hypothetical protein